MADGEKRPPRVDWTAEEDEAIRAGVKSGRCFRVIAETMLPNRTRNSVIGRAHRLGIVFQQPLKRAKKKPPVKPSKPSAASKSIAQLFPKPIALVSPKPEPKPKPDGLGPTILELHPGQCKWPTKQDSAGIHRFCGTVTAKVGGVYCSHHHAISWRPNR